MSADIGGFAVDDVDAGGEGLSEEAAIEAVDFAGGLGIPGGLRDARKLTVDGEVQGVCHGLAVAINDGHIVSVGQTSQIGGDAHILLLPCFEVDWVGGGVIELFAAVAGEDIYP